MSQIFYLGPSFSNEIKTRTYIKNLRHSFLQGNVLIISEKCHVDL